MANINCSQLSADINPTRLSPYIDFGGLAVLSDTVNTPQPFKMIVVTGSGIVSWLNINGDAQSIYCGIPGQPYYIRGIRLLSAGTTATGIYWGGGQ